ncbi:BMC domain-containing protein [Listeria monocytogenes]|uniref:BMC domain-containing protein n=1 Tax=Listeria monocytogenes TaxID=1639 RepID=UPI000766747F|nr:BMC domain-containing protein [Listeria monocytogenes]CWU03390.1 carboxysome structural protein EutK [Listeria monocytogenes]CWV70763.1 carboxysome structural protein EutK [Listeria monocytogenes]
MKMDTLGFLELNSISKGIEAVDTMLKAANSELIYAKASCPGKYYILIAGTVDSVAQSIEAGTKIGAANIVGNLVIPRVSDQVIKAINKTEVPDEMNAVGVMEYYSCSGSIIAADVQLMDIRLATGIAGKSFVVLTGDTAACEAAVEAGLAAAKEEALLINKVVIPRPRKEVFESLIY